MNEKLLKENEEMTDSIPPGYKKTEIGIIPEEWEVKKLGEVADCLDEYRIPLNEEERRKMKGTIPYCGANGVLDYVNGYTIDDDIILLAEDGGHFDEYKNKPIAYRMIGKCWVNNHAHIIKAKAGYSQDFLFYSLVHKDIREYIGGGTRSKLNKSEMFKIELLLPPTVEEQRAIAQILSDFDALIESLGVLIEKKKNIKKGAMQELLTGKKRLPGFTGEWVRKRLGEVALKISTGSKNNEDKVENGKYPFFVRSDIVERIDTYSFDCEAIIVPGEGKIGEIFHYIKGKFDAHQRVYVIRNFKNDVHVKYVYYYMQQFFGAHAFKNSVKATVDSLRLPTFKNFELLLPPTVEEQRAIAQILSDMDAEIEALEQKKKKYEMMKKAAMELLLTGKVRVIEKDGKIEVLK